MEYFRCFNTQPPEGGWLQFGNATAIEFGVSTHSRPKAAGVCAYRNYGRVDSFNTQPPEGGWVATSATVVISGRFQHTAARRRLAALERMRQMYG